MKYAFCLFKYFPYGGLQRDFLKIFLTCQKRGHSIRTYTLSWDGEMPEGMDVIIVPVSAMTNHKLYERYHQWVQAHLSSHPVDAVVGFNKMPGLDVYYAADSCYEEKARTQRSWLYRQLPRYRHFSEFERAVFSEDSKTDVMMISDTQLPFFVDHYNTRKDKLHFLPPGISHDRVLPDNWREIRDSLRKEFNIGSDEKLLLMVGSGFVKKGVKRAIRAVKSLPSAVQKKTHLFIVGEDKPEPFNRLIRILGLTERVRILQGRDDIPRFMQGSDILLHPALDENAGIVLLEALVGGLPVIATDVCGYGHYVEETGIGQLIESPFRQKRLNQVLLSFILTDKSDQWKEKGKRFAQSANIYSMAQDAASFIESSVQKLSYRPGAKGELALCLYKYFPFGGLQRDFISIAQQCKKRGYSVRVYTLSWQGEVPDNLDIVLVPAIALTNHKRYQLYHEWVMQDIRRRPVKAMIGFNKMPDLDIYYAADSCYEDKARTQRNALYRLLPRYRHFSRYETAVFDESSRTEVLMISSVQKPLFQKYYHTPEERIHILPPGIDRDRILAGKNGTSSHSVKEEFGMQPKDPLILTIGSGFVTKGLDRTIRAVRSLPPELRDNCRLIVIGKDNPTPFLRLANRLGIKDRVSILGGRDDVPRFLYAADLLIHPAYVENTGTVLLEAMVAGLPVLASDVCGYAHYVTDADAGRLVESPFSQQKLNSLLLEMLISNQRKDWRKNAISFTCYADIYSMPERAAEYIDQVIG